jgi:dihydropyrimidinase
VSAAAQEGIAALAETCPHYLLLDDSAYGGEYGERYLCCPPLRSRSTMATLRRELVAGRIDAIGSDHCCYRQAQKLVGRSAAPDAPMGLPGVDLRNVLILDLVARGELRLELAVRVLAEIPAQFAGIFPQKGIVAPGADADLVLWDPKSSWVIGSPEVGTASDYTPFEGHNVSVAPRYVFRKGRCVARDGEVASPQSDSNDGFLVSAGPSWRPHLRCMTR